MTVFHQPDQSEVAMQSCDYTSRVGISRRNEKTEATVSKSAKSGEEEHPIPVPFSFAAC